MEWVDQILDIWASVQMPKYSDQIAQSLGLDGNKVRVHYDVDVGGSYGVKRGIKHAVLMGYVAKLGCPVRFIEDRLENMRGLVTPADQNANLMSRLHLITMVRFVR